MRREVWDCDRCKKKNLIAVVMVPVVVGTSSEGSGSSDNIYESVDLCCDCATLIIKDFLLPLRWEERKDWVGSVTRKRGL